MDDTPNQGANCGCDCEQCAAGNHEGCTKPGMCQFKQGGDTPSTDGGDSGNEPQQQ